jgi:hypothetical protein
MNDTTLLLVDDEPQIRRVLQTTLFEAVWFAKTLADCEINDIAGFPSVFCYNS